MNMERFVTTVVPACYSSLHQALSVFQLMGWVFGIYFPSFAKYCTINTSPEMKGANHTGVQSDTQGCM